MILYKKIYCYKKKLMGEISYFILWNISLKDVLRWTLNEILFWEKKKLLNTIISRFKTKWSDSL